MKYHTEAIFIEKVWFYTYTHPPTHTLQPPTHTHIPSDIFDLKFTCNNRPFLKIARPQGINFERYGKSILDMFFNSLYLSLSEEF